MKTLNPFFIAGLCIATIAAANPIAASQAAKANDNIERTGRKQRCLGPIGETIGYSVLSEKAVLFLHPKGTFINDLARRCPAILEVKSLNNIRFYQNSTFGQPIVKSRKLCKNDLIDVLPPQCISVWKHLPAGRV